jgi:hypothetical protein
MTDPDPNKIKESNPKDAIGCRKPALSVLSMPVLYEMGAGLTEGACKYRRHNFRVIGVRASVYFDATMRHLAAWWEGQDIDPDSGLHHVSKALASLHVLRDAMICDKVHDDRPPRVHASWIAKARERVDEILARYPNPADPYTQTNLED